MVPSAALRHRENVWWLSEVVWWLSEVVWWLSEAVWWLSEAETTTMKTNGAFGCALAPRKRKVVERKQLVVSTSLNHQWKPTVVERNHP